MSENSIIFAKAGKDLEKEISIELKMANRHGFICGATGTGKTVTLKVISEAFSRAGVPVFLSDIKGDLSGMMMAGESNDDMKERIERFGIGDSFSYRAYPTEFFDVYGESGIPLRTTVTEMGPLLLSQCLGLNDTQTDLLTVAFKIADDLDLLLIDLKDIKAMLNYIYDNQKELETEYGHMAKQSITAIIRSIAALEAEGGEKFFGEPAIDISDFIRLSEDGQGYINILDAKALMNKPKLYSAFLLFLLSELFEELPEVGDPEKPKMVVFFDEAHLIFDNTSSALKEKMAQVIKLIRSKGVGVYFVTQSPGDISDKILSQLSNKVEHALRAYTPAERKALKAAAESFRENPDFDTLELLEQLGTGEAIVSVLGDDGVPGVAEHAYILPPESYIGVVTDAARKDNVLKSSLIDKYYEMKDRDSCYEFMARKMKIKEEAEQREEEAEKARIEQEKAEREQAKEREKAEREAEKAAEEAAKQNARAVKSVLSTTAGTIGRQLGNTIGKSLGGKYGKTLGGNIGASLGRNILGTLFRL